MTGFIRGNADLTSRRIGSFKVYGLSGSYRNGKPRWEVICTRCNRAQIFDHTVLCNAIECGKPDQALHCQNSACIRSRPVAVRTETLGDIRRAEQEDQRRIESETKSKRDAAAKETAKQAAIEGERKQYIQFANSQIRAGLDLEDVMTFESWRCQSEHWREDVLRRVGVI